MMKGMMVFGGIAVMAMVAAAPFSVAVADTLTRSGCWTAKVAETGATRTLCFSGARRATMRNRNHIINSNAWSSCEATGDYLQRDDKVTVTFAQGSGRCSNGAAAPQWGAVCTFTGENLDCQGSAVVNGKTFEIQLLFE
jgi:hypothetical protein